MKALQHDSQRSWDVQQRLRRVGGQTAGDLLFGDRIRSFGLVHGRILHRDGFRFIGRSFRRLVGRFSIPGVGIRIVRSGVFRHPRQAATFVLTLSVCLYSVCADFFPRLRFGGAEIGLKIRSSVILSSAASSTDNFA